MKGRGVGKPHRARRDKQTIPVFGFDYMHTCVVCDTDEGEGSHTTKVLVAKCQKTQCVFSHVVPQKGIDPRRYVVDRHAQDVVWLGHARVILKSDNEIAILKLLKEVFKSLGIRGLEQAAESRRTRTLRENWRAPVRRRDVGRTAPGDSAAARTCAGRGQSITIT